MIPIPDFIIKRLGSHITDHCPTAEAGWEFGNQDEDTLTGDFFGNLRTPWNTLNGCEWRFHYNKIRGRGPGALEKKIGADGIITLHYKRNGKDYFKSLVFQAKKSGNPIDSTQLDKMRQFFPGGNLIINYSPNGYTGSEDPFREPRNLCQLIADDFLNCKIGLEGLWYDHDKNKFIRPNNIPISGTIKKELMIEVFQNP